MNYCQECGAELPTGGRGRPRKFCDRHTQRAKQLQRKTSRPECCQSGTCEQHKIVQRLNRDGKARAYNSAHAGSRNYRGRQVKSNGYVLPDTTATMLSKWRPGARPGLHAKLRRQGYTVDQIRRVMAAVDALAELEAQRLRWNDPR